MLFDLQAILSWAANDVPKAVIQRVQEGYMVYVSAASTWEFVLKEKRYKFNIEYAQLLKTIEHLDGGILPIKTEHLARLRTMATVKDDNGKDHNDPFDRLLIAQALEEDLVLVGADQMFPVYQKELALKLLWEKD